MKGCLTNVICLNTLLKNGLISLYVYPYFELKDIEKKHTNESTTKNCIKWFGLKREQITAWKIYDILPVMSLLKMTLNRNNHG